MLKVGHLVEGCRASRPGVRVRGQDHSGKTQVMINERSAASCSSTKRTRSLSNRRAPGNRHPREGDRRAPRSARGDTDRLRPRDARPAEGQILVSDRVCRSRCSSQTTRWTSSRVLPSATCSSVWLTGYERALLGPSPTPCGRSTYLAPEWQRSVRTEHRGRGAPSPVGADRRRPQRRSPVAELTVLPEDFLGLVAQSEDLVGRRSPS